MTAKKYLKKLFKARYQYLNKVRTIFPLVEFFLQLFTRIYVVQYLLNYIKMYAVDNLIVHCKDLLLM